MRRQRLDSISGAKKIATEMKVIKFPDYVFKADGADVYFDNIISQKASAIWTAHEVELVAMLACSMALFDKERKQLVSEGRVIVNASGNPVNNPRVNTSRDLWSEIIQGRRTLGIQEAAKGNSADREKQNKLAQEIEAGLQPSGLNENNLLAN